MDNDFFSRNEDAILRAQHPAYASFCDEDEADVEYDPACEGEMLWELQDER